MLSISRILVPVDFSDRCLEILPYATAIATHYHAELTLLHVVNPMYSIPAAGPLGPILISLPPSVFEEAGKRLETFGADQLGGVAVRRLVYEGDPVEQMVDLTLAEKDKTDLIVMPTHGYGAVRRFLIGSVTAKVLHDAACPVLTSVHAGRPAFSKVLCALNLGPESERTLSWASQLAIDFQARLEVVHATTSANSGQARERLVELLNAVGTKADSLHIADGDPVEAICSTASSTAADLLVIGRDVSGASSGKLKTHGFAIVRHSPCPVVSV